MGLGTHGGGVAAVRFLAGQGARVTISDAADADVLASSVASLSDIPGLTWRLGGHDVAEFRRAECVVVNPAVRSNHPCLQIARESGAQITSEIELFLEPCRGTVIGVTGSSGKSSTVTMLAAILSQAGCRAFLGGNIGVSLLPQLAEIGADDCVVLELSSFQLKHLSASCPRTSIAIVTNCTPNHLDWHDDYADYQTAKQRLIAGPLAAATVVLNTADPVVASWQALATGEVKRPWNLDAFGPLCISGLHQRQNAASAAAAAEVALQQRGKRLDRHTVDAALARFTGLPHRLTRLPDVAGRRIYDDSKSTTPAATVAALEAVDRAWLLLGGRDKGAKFDCLCAALARRALGVAVYGEAREKLRQYITAANVNIPLFTGSTLAEALEWSFAQSRVGDAILLSPACASLDQFRDYIARGEHFAEMVKRQNNSLGDAPRNQVAPLGSACA
jgi:UDP-N-acetylmuramoylalanine--D-glutamate ligase